MNQEIDMIPFNVPPFIGHEISYISEAVSRHKISGDGRFTFKCNQMLEDMTGTRKALLTTSCTHALEMAAILCGIEQGDEVIMPSYAFTSMANAFVLRGAEIVFVDIRPDTMNIDETKIEAAITDMTKVIVLVHYAGVSCEMDYIMAIARKYNLLVVEDAAHAIGSSYKGKPLGSIGDFGTLSFHETKNISCGEGGALLINNEKYIERAEIIREKGTDRSKFFRGEADKYSWRGIGSSYLPSELNAAYVAAQLEKTEQINSGRLETWNYYTDSITALAKREKIEIAAIPPHCVHNAHMFWIKAKDLAERTELLQFLKENDIGSVFHYIPLHSSTAGRKFGRFYGEDVYTTTESERLVRLPLYYGMTPCDKEKVVEYVCKFYNE
jgi:dTDP-4-amino-4,6-dideoxygalactose transaminase